jgi:hypothetical protein
MVVIGGVDELVATYDKVAGFLRVLPRGETAAITLTIAGNLVLGVFYSVVQVLAYRRALRRWPDEAQETPVVSAGDTAEAAPELAAEASRRHLPAWPVVVVAAAGCVALLTSTEWALLGAVAGILAVAVLLGRTFDWATWRLGLALAALLAFSAIVPAIIGAVSWDDALPRGARIILFVLVATWARAAAGVAGIRRVARRSFEALRLRTAAALTDELESDARLLPAGRALVAELEGVETKPVPMADALTRWVAAESAAYRR